MPWGANQKPPNQRQTFSGAWGAFRQLGLVALVFVLVVGGFLALQTMWDKRPLDLAFLLGWAFWALAIVGLVAGYGLGNQLGRAFTHRQRWRHAAPWIVIIGLATALSWTVGANLEALAGRAENPIAPIALLFGVVCGVIEYRNRGRIRR